MKCPLCKTETKSFGKYEDSYLCVDCDITFFPATDEEPETQIAMPKNVHLLQQLLQRILECKNYKTRIFNTYDWGIKIYHDNEPPIELVHI